MTISNETTVKQLIESGLISASLVDVWNSRLEREARKSAQSKQVDTLSAFILGNLQAGKLYKTGDFIKDSIAKFPEFVASESDLKDKRIKIHKLITSALKKLVKNEDIVVINTTNNHAHNRYGLKPDTDAVPDFAVNSEETNKDEEV